MDMGGRFGDQPGKAGLEEITGWERTKHNCLLYTSRHTSRGWANFLLHGKQKPKISLA